MNIENVISKLEKLKREYGNVDVLITYNDEMRIDIEPVKYVKYRNEYHNTIDIDTEDLDEEYLEKCYNDKIIEKGVCVKIY